MFHCFVFEIFVLINFNFMARLVVWLKEEKNFLYRVQSPAEKDIVV